MTSSKHYITVRFDYCFRAAHRLEGAWPASEIPAIRNLHFQPVVPDLSDFSAHLRLRKHECGFRSCDGTCRLIPSAIACSSRDKAVHPAPTGVETPW